MDFKTQTYPIIALGLALLCSLSTLSSCGNDDTPMAKAVLASANQLNFDGTNASEKLITVYSDATWTVDAPSWVTVTPTSGTAPPT